MKCRFALVGLALAGLLTSCGSPPPVERPAVEPPSSPLATAPSVVAEQAPAEPPVAEASAPVAPSPPDLTALRERVVALEAQLASASAAAPVEPAPSSVETLRRSIDALDGQAFSRDLERLLVAGEPGFAILAVFLESGAGAHALPTWTRQPQLALAALRAIVRQPDAVALFSRWLLRHARTPGRAPLRGELYGYLPVFLRHHVGRYPELRQELEQDLVSCLEQPDTQLYRALLAVRELELRPPVDPLVRILGDAARQSSHTFVIKQLSSLGDEGFTALARYVREPKQGRQPSLPAVLQEIAHLEQKSDRGVIVACLKDADPQVRWYAGVAFFSFARDLGAYPQAVELLDAEIDAKLKRTFLLRLRQRNQPIFDKLVAQAATLPRADVRDLVQQVAAQSVPRSSPAPLLPRQSASVAPPPAASAGSEETGGKP